MFFQSSLTKVRYCETDQMGFVHHSNYVAFFELARIEWLDSLGLSYSEMEKNGILMPVVNLELEFLKPLFFGDGFRTTVSLVSPPTATVVFTYDLFNGKGEMVCKGSTRLAFLDAVTKRPVRCPKKLRDLFKDS